MNPARLAVLGSGEGTNFEALAAAAGKSFEIVVVGSDRCDARILSRAESYGVPTFSLVPAEFAGPLAHDEALANVLARFEPDGIALAGYLRRIGPRVLRAWAGRMLNIHPALLPAFPGLRTHERALASGAHEHGATVHFVTAEIDAGPRIVQGRLRPRAGEAAAELGKRVQALEHRIYPLAVEWFATGRVSMKDGTTWFDGRPLREPIVIEDEP